MPSLDRRLSPTWPQEVYPQEPVSLQLVGGFSHLPEKGGSNPQATTPNHRLRVAGWIVLLKQVDLTSVPAWCSVNGSWSARSSLTRRAHLLVSLMPSLDLSEAPGAFNEKPDPSIRHPGNWWLGVSKPGCLKALNQSNWSLWAEKTRR